MKKIILFYIYLLCHFVVSAQGGNRDLSFSATAGTDGKVWAIALQPDGKILLGGFFQHCNGVKQRHIARLNADGTLDTTFHTGEVPGNTVQTISVQADGKIIIGGTFLNHKSTNKANHLARLNADGSLDTTFHIGTGFQGGSIWTTLIQPDGKILVGGSFFKFNGVLKKNLVRLNPTGTLDNTFAITPTSYAGTSVFALALQPDNKILVGSAENIMRVSSTGQLDTAFFNHTSFFVGSIRELCVQANGEMVIAGPFIMIAGKPWYHIGRLNSLGYNDTSFYQSPSNLNMLKTFHSIALQNDGKIIAGGRLKIFDNLPQNCLIRLNANGTKDPSFDIGTGFNGYVHKVLIQPDGKILAVGEFTEYKGNQALHIIRLLP